jgi:hypothetical protein
VGVQKVSLKILQLKGNPGCCILIQGNGANEEGG